VLNAAQLNLRTQAKKTRAEINELARSAVRSGPRWADERDRDAWSFHSLKCFGPGAIQQPNDRPWRVPGQDVVCPKEE